MNPAARQILAHLQNVDALRAERLRDPALAARVHAVKAYQARRFARTYDDLHGTERYRGAVRFFLEELYGPQEFAERDAQFARVVPALVRMFTHEIVDTVATLVELHDVSETMDSTMARYLDTDVPDAATYVRAWQASGRPAVRQRQVDLTLQVGHALDRYTRSAVLRGALRLMRRPAHAAGLADLQQFLEDGFDTFGELDGAEEFLALVRTRESALIAALFAPDAIARVTALARQPTRVGDSPLHQLP